MFRSQPKPSFKSLTPEEILGEVSSIMLATDRYIEQWRSFMDQNEEAFNGSSQSKEEGGEYGLGATEIHQRFTELVESQLDEVLSQLGLATAEFMTMCSSLEDFEDDGSLQSFLQIVLGSSDFAVFGDIMRSPEKRRYYFQILGMWKSSLKQSDQTRAEAK
jgi:hypothetical protein